MTMTRSRFCLLLLVCASLAHGDEFPYQKPPKEILDVLHAPAPPTTLVSPTGRHVLIAERELMPPIAELAKPMHRLAGLRINPANNGKHLPPATLTGLAVKSVETGAETKIALPAGVRFTMPSWSPDGKRFAMLGYTANAVELYFGSVDSAALRRVPNLRIDDTMDGLLDWWAGSTEVLVRAVPPKRVRRRSGRQLRRGRTCRSRQARAGRCGPIRTC